MALTVLDHGLGGYNMNNNEKIDLIQKMINGLKESIKELNDMLNGNSEMTLEEDDIQFVGPTIDNQNRQISALESLKQVLST